MRDMLAYAWPGNVRELGNLVRQLAVSNRGRAAYVADARVKQQLARPSPEAPDVTRTESREVSDEVLVEALRAHAFAVGPTAQSLGIPRSTLYGLMERSASVRKATDLAEPELSRGLQQHQGNLTALAAALEVSERALRLRLRALGLLD